MIEDFSRRIFMVMCCALVCTGAMCQRTTPLKPAVDPEDIASPDPVEVGLAECAEGRLRLGDGHCCWPGQSWSPSANACEGAAICPEGMLFHEDTCQVVESMQEGCALGIEAACVVWMGTLEGACPQDASSCAKLARMLETRGALEEAKGLYLGACDQGMNEECMRGVELTRDGEGWRDPTGAAKFLSRPCAANFAKSCELYLGLAVSQCPGEGCDLVLVERLAAGLESDRPAMVAQRRISACVGWSHGGDEGPGPCAGLTAFAGRVDGSSAEGMPSSEALLAVACTGVEDPPSDHLGMADPGACLLLAQRLLANGQDSRGAGLLRRSCAVDVFDACLRLGVLYRDGRGVPRDSRRAVRFFQTTCDEGLWQGCTELGVMLAGGKGVAKDAGAAMDLFERSCDAGEPSGCHHLALGLLPRDEVRALELFKRACLAGHRPSCGR